MRSKAPLALMEQLVMVLVFALAAALCLQVFVLSDQSSRLSEARDRAVVECQRAAELMKSNGDKVMYAQEAAKARMGGHVTQGEEPLWLVCYDGEWNVLEGLEAPSPDTAYTLQAQGLPTEVEGLAKARIWAADLGSGRELFSMDVAWQEVARHE